MLVPKSCQSEQKLSPEVVLDILDKNFVNMKFLMI